MSVSKKLLQAAAGAAGGAGLDVDEVFSTYLYDGNNSGQTITNGIDLSGEGGLVWTKARDYGVGHALVDTVRGNTKYLEANGTDAESTTSVGITAFNSTGYNLGADDTWKFNVSNSYVSEYASWTFRKAPKFFDVVTYTGNGSNRTIAHSLGSDVGMLIVKRLDSDKSWAVFHRQFNSGSSPANYWDQLNNAQAIQSNSTIWNNTAPTSSVFSLGTANVVNQSGGTYVAYLFAHNNNDGEFGPDSDQDIIKCGSYTNGASGVEVNLGFEPQWMMFKKTDGTGNWGIVDVMRGIKVVSSVGDNSNQLRANLNNAENAEYHPYPTPTGFKTDGSGGGGGAGTGDYIYMAIRRGPLAEPESATDVFGVNYAYTYDVDGNTGGSSAQIVGYIGEPADLNIQGYRSGSSFNAAVFDRLRNNNYLITNTTSAETSISGNFWDNMAGFREVASGQDTTMIEWTWKRAPSYFDVVAYDGGNGSSINHNLGVTPEMYWIKCRSDGSTNRGWAVYHKDATTQASKYLRLDTTDALISLGVFNNGTIDANTFSANNGYSIVNESGQTYIAYLFATVAGVSKVGSYTGNGTNQNIDCGFSSGARFVLIKNADATGSWVVFDTVRGIVAGNDNYLRLDSTSAEGGGYDFIDPLSSGFTINQTGGVVLNESGQTYIFYAIA